eukprot:1078369-Prymnesium_polylepis.1
MGNGRQDLGVAGVREHGPGQSGWRPHPTVLALTRGPRPLARPQVSVAVPRTDPLNASVPRTQTLSTP